MDIAILAGIFLISLVVLITGSAVFLRQAEKLGVALGMPAFIIGVFIVGVGTSLPELASGIAAVLNGATEIVTANAIGSNIANTMLVVGILGVIGGRLVITKDLLDAELPFFVTSTVIFLGIVANGSVSTIEAMLLFSLYVIYIAYLFTHDQDIDTVVSEKREEIEHAERKHYKDGIYATGLGILGLVGVLGGAHALITSATAIAELLSVAPGLVSISAIALGTSLPELSVSLRALQQNKVDLAIGNIFGSNAFNILLAVGIPGLLTPLALDVQTFTVGVPILAASAFIFFVLGMARKIYRWEGLMFLVFYLFFMIKLLGV